MSNAADRTLLPPLIQGLRTEDEFLFAVVGPGEAYCKLLIVIHFTKKMFRNTVNLRCRMIYLVKAIVEEGLRRRDGLRMSRAIKSRFFLALSAFLVVSGAAVSEESPPETGDETPVVFETRIVGDESRSRFVADLTGDAKANVFTLADPYRVVVDMSEVSFRLDEDAGTEGRGLFSAFRFGSISPGRSRIVLDVDGPVRVDKFFVLPPDNGQPARMVIDIVPTERETFLQASRAYREHQQVETAARRDRAFGSEADLSDQRPTIVLDPGHGGIDTGAKGRSGAVEKVLTLEFAKILGEKLKATGRYNVLFTRTTDTFVALGDRVAYARDHGAALLISIHANYFRGRSIRGAIIYTASDKASDRMAAELAELENQADTMAGIDISDEDQEVVKDILLDLTRRETRNFGTVFAQNLIEEMKETTPMFKKPHQQAGFKVLEAPDVPSALIELGFVSNAEDEKMLMSDDWRGEASESIVRAIDDFFETRVAQRSAQ